MPDLVIKELTGDVEQYQDFFAALEKTSPFAMGFEALSGSIKGRCNNEEKCILINEGMTNCRISRPLSMKLPMRHSMT